MLEFMAKLETQIDQIYLLHPEARKTSLILYDEDLTGAHHLFVLAELRELKKKTDEADLKRITEIILVSFRSQKRLSAENLFEAALSQINQNLADLAHEGRKSWVGKFSCLIALKSGENIFVANSGPTSAWLKRKSELLEILGLEKLGIHPIKMFQNFTQGKILGDDSIILTTSNIFNYISLELFGKILNQFPPSEVCQKISKILQDAAGADQAFATFFLYFGKKREFAPLETIPSSSYLPSPEELEPVAQTPMKFFEIFSRIRLPKFNFRLPQIPKFNKPNIPLNFFNKLSTAGKFFFYCFFIFLILFLINLSLYGFKLRSQRVAERIEAQVEILSDDIASAQSALIYKDEEQAFKFLIKAEDDYKQLLELAPNRASEFSAKFEQLHNQVNKTSVVDKPSLYAEFKRHPVYLAKNPSGFLLSGTDSNSLTNFDGTNNDYFLLNSLDQPITSISYWQSVGVAVSLNDKIYRINEALKQFELMLSLGGSEIIRMKTYNNILYALDKKNQQLLRVVASKGKFTTQLSKNGLDATTRDFAIDTNRDVYFLQPDKIVKASGINFQAFPLPFMSEPITNATRIFIGSSLYILEPNKKRVVIISKAGNLINQIAFPTTQTPLDLFVDEAQRNLFLLDDNLLYRITF